MQKKICKKFYSFLSTLLSFALIFGTLPIAVFAEASDSIIIDDQTEAFEDEPEVGAADYDNTIQSELPSENANSLEDDANSAEAIEAFEDEPATNLARPTVEDSVVSWSFTTEQNQSVQAIVDNLPTLDMTIHLENVTDVAQISGTYQWFARLANAPLHETGVPVTIPSQINIAQAIDSGYRVALQLNDEVGIIPRLPGLGEENNVIMGGTFISEEWEYFVVVEYEVANAEVSTIITSIDDGDLVIALTVEYVDFVLNRPPRNYFPNVNYPDLANLLPMTPYLNDPFIFLESFMSETPQLGTNGQVVTEADWWARNEEIRDIIGYYMYGILHDTPIENITVNSPTTLDLGEANPINVTIRSNGRVWTGNIGNITMPTAQQIEASPFTIDAGIPIVLGGTNLHALANGIATATITGPTLNASGNGGGAYFTLHPFNFGITEFNVGSIMANVWHSSRLLDAIEISDWGINPNASATIGVSIGGKIALFRGVMDERVALTVPVESGAFGMTSLRDTTEARVSFHHVNQFANHIFGRAQKPLNSAGFTGEMAWFGMGAFRNPVAGDGSVFNDIFARLPKAESIYLMPFDQHMVAALAAPRALLSFDNDGTGSGNGWMNPYTQLTIAEGAREVYDFLGVRNNIAVRVRDQNHAVQARDWPFVVGTLIAMFGDDRIFDVDNPREITDITIEQVAEMTPPSYDFGIYDNIHAMTASPFELDSHFIQWARPGNHAIWTHTQLVTKGHEFTIEAHTTAPAGTEIVLNVFNHGDRNHHWEITPQLLESWVSTVGTDGIARFELDSNQSQVGRYQLTFADSSINHRPAYFLGIDRHTALRSAVSPGLSHMYRTFGFTSRINPDTVSVYTVTNEGIETYIPSAPVEEAITMPETNLWGGWIMEYGVAMPGQGVAGGANNRLPADGTLTLRGLQFEAIPDFTFEVSFGLGGNGAAANHGVPWSTSEAVQLAQPFPHWAPVGGLFGLGGEDGPFGARADGTRPFAPPTQTDFDAVLNHSLIINPTTQDPSAWVIDFDQPMNPRDFGVGFNFSDDFTIAWGQNYEQVVIAFNTVDLEQVATPEMIIMRLRDATSTLGNVISTYMLIEAPEIPQSGVGELFPQEITLAPNRVRGFEVDGFGVDRAELSWSLSGNLSAETTIENGFLRIAGDNPPGTIVVRAYVTADPTIYGIAVVTVGGASTSLIHNLPAGLNFDQYPSLRAVYADYFIMGVAGDAHLIAGDAGVANLRGQLIGHHYNSWSFENSMKPQPLRGNNAANRLQPSNQWPGIAGPTNTMNAALARYAGMSFAGHTTAWHSQSPDWMWDRHASGNTNREVALENLQFHIHETFRQFGDQISSMDVVNEALGSVNPANPEDWRSALTRGEGWAPTLGYDWVMYAFIFAAEIVDELGVDVTLYYNDFLLHTTNKGIATYTMVRDINQMHANGEIVHPITGAPFLRDHGKLLIEGIGMQDRHSGIIDIDGFSTAINLFATLGVVVSITEMDLSWRITSPDGLLTPAEQIAQGQQMARFFEMIRRYATGPATAGSPYPRVVERVTFWGIDDDHAWAPGEPMLFGRPTGGTIPGKEALRAVLDPFQFLEDHPWFPEEMPPVAGVNIFNLQDDGFSGANIILGNDAEAWPFSTAGEDGAVAFTPEPGATYHLLVYYQSFETFGLEAHWLTDNSENNFTSANLEATTTLETIIRGVATEGDAAPAANAIPTRFFNPGVGGSFAWLETTFTMPADASADDLLGNIALRGYQAGDGIAIHSIIIHRLDDAGNQAELLVNYPYQLPLIRPEIPGIIALPFITKVCYAIKTGC